MNDPNETVTKFFDAVERASFAEVDALYADDVAIWHSTDDQTQGKEENLAVLRGAAGVVRFRYEVVHRSSVNNVVAQHHKLHLTRLDNGSSTTIQAAIFITVTNNKISRIDEFIEQSSDEKIKHLLA